MLERDLDAIDWEHLVEEIREFADSLRQGCVYLATRSIRWLLQIEHYPVGPKKLKRWHERAWRCRMDLHYARQECPGLFQREGEAMLAEGWKYARKIAIRKMARLDARCGNLRVATVYQDSIWKARRASWDREVPQECCYTFEELVGYSPRQHPVREPDPTYWPPAVQRKLREAFGPELTPAYPDRKAPKRGWHPLRPDDTVWPPGVAKVLREYGLLEGEADTTDDEQLV